VERRIFNKLLAITGAVSCTQAAAQTSNASPNDPASPTDPAVPQQRQDVTQTSEPPSSHPVTVSDFIALAQAKLPKSTFEYITTGSEDQVTLQDNVAAFRRLRVLPPLCHGVETSDLSTTVLKQPISLPVLLAPVAALSMFHPQGTLAAARAAETAETIFVPSTSAGNSVEEIRAATQGPLWFQLYVPQDRRIARRLVERAEQAGYQAIVVTVDLGERKDADLRNNFQLPKEMLLKNLRDIGHTQLTDKMSYQDLITFNLQAWSLSLSWEFFDWLRSVTKLPLIVKGVLSKKDALQAVELGLDGIIVSNHGGRRLDGVPASIDVLPEIVDAVNGRTVILLDSGVRRGGDVLRAVALGADAVLIGRPYAWGLAADGQTGVKRVLDILRDELLNAMITTGCRNISDIDRSLIVA